MLNTKLRSLVFSSLVLCSVENALAEDAYLRLRCEGEAAGATVSVNGVKKGECPIDLAVREGKVKVSVRKDLTPHSYKVYEKELFLASGAMKRETVVLGPVQFTPEGQRIENERLAKEREATALREAQAAAAAEKQRLAAEAEAKLGMTQDYLDLISTQGRHTNEGPITGTSALIAAPLYLPMSILFDASSGKQMLRAPVADPVAFAKPDSMAGKAALARTGRITPDEPVERIAAR